MIINTRTVIFEVGFTSFVARTDTVLWALVQIREAVFQEARY